MLFLVLLALQASEPGVDPADISWARQAWESTGRGYVGGLLGLRWEAGSGRWRAESLWEGNLGVSGRAYYAEPVLSPVLALAEVMGDSLQIVEIADLYLAALPRFTTLTALRESAFGHCVTGERDTISPGATRALPWWCEGVAAGGAVECQLCQIQFLYPAARAVRLVRTFWNGRTPPPIADSFVSAYLPLLVQDHLLRLGMVAPAGIPAAGSTSRSIVDVWLDLGNRGPFGDQPWLSGLRDRDLLLIATAAELAATPDRAGGLDSLGGYRRAVIRLLQAGQARLVAMLTPHPETRDRAGQVVGSLGYGEGMWDGHREFAFVGYQGSEFPDEAFPVPRTAWDLSHLTRLPVALRALWDARPALRSGFPDSALLAGLGRQYAYVAYAGALPVPRFRNFFDGSDGWYRVGYGGRPNFGYPPSTLCDMRSLDRPCVGAWAARGWGLLAFASPPIDSVQRQMLALARSDQAEEVAERDRMYTWQGVPLAFGAPSPPQKRSMILAAIVSELALGQRR